MKNSNIILSLSILVLFSSCKVTMQINPEKFTPADNVSRIQQNSESLKSIAVLNFTPSDRIETPGIFYNILKMDVNLPNNGKISTNIAEKELFKYVEIVDRQTMDKIIQELNLQNTSLFDNATAVEIGKLVGCSAVLTGHVDYAYSKLRSQQSAYGGYLATYLGYVSVNMRLIDVKTGKILWIGSISRNSQNYLSEPLIVTNMELIKNPDIFTTYMHGSNPEEITKYLLKQAIKESIDNLSNHI